jgi:hypothetical protein
MGPNDAPTIEKNPIRLFATPVIASTALTVMAAKVERVRGKPGSIVLKLLDAIKEEKHVGTRQAAANKKNIAGASTPTLAIAAEKS